MPIADYFILRHFFFTFFATPYATPSRRLSLIFRCRADTAAPFLSFSYAALFAFTPLLSIRSLPPRHFDYASLISLRHRC
jgi:hypothetical protein